MLYNISNSYPPPAAALPTVCDFCSAVFIHHSRLCALFLALLPSPSRGALPILGVVGAGDDPRAETGRTRPGACAPRTGRPLRKRRSSCLMNSLIALAKRASSFNLGSESVVLKWSAALTKAPM